MASDVTLALQCWMATIPSSLPSPVSLAARRPQLEGQIVLDVVPPQAVLSSGEWSASYQCKPASAQ